MDWALTFYVNFLNQTRFTKKMSPDPNGPRALHPKTPTKWAVLSVMTTQYWLSVTDVIGLLNELSYRRCRSTLLKAIKRCETFGLLGSMGRPRKRSWKLSLRGRDLINAPRKTMAAKIRDVIEVEIGAANQWMSVSDLFKSTTYNPNTISRVLRSNRHLFKCELIPGDRYRRKQWAHHTKDTTGWASATPNKLPKVLFAKKVSKPSPVSAGAVVILNPRYQGFPMCLSAATAAKPSLIQAVGDLVTSEFVPAQKKFSAHDVTKRMRELVSQPTTTVSPAETGTVHVAGRAVPKIAHEDVREIVHELFNQGLMTGYDRVHVGQYFEYDLVANIAAVAPSPVQSVPTQTPDPTPAGVSGSAYDGSSTV